MMGRWENRTSEGRRSAAPIIPSSHHPIIPSSHHPIIPSSHHPIIPSSHHPIILKLPQRGTMGRVESPLAPRMVEENVRWREPPGETSV
jgi:hypothetical protein